MLHKTQEDLNRTKEQRSIAERLVSEKSEAVKAMEGQNRQMEERMRRMEEELKRLEHRQGREKERAHSVEDEVERYRS